MQIDTDILNWEYASEPQMVHALVVLAAHQERNGNTEYSLSQLTKILNVTTRQARTILSRMEKTGIVTRQATSKATSITFCKYVDYISCTTNKMTSKATNSKTKSKEKTVTSTDLVKPQAEKHPFGEAGNVMLTRKEYSNLIAKIGERDTQDVINIVSCYKASNGKKYKSDYYAILNWGIKRLRQDQAEQNKQNIINYGYTKHTIAAANRQRAAEDFLTFQAQGQSGSFDAAARIRELQTGG